ncbi:MAG: ABC transporter permease [bacterium]|nr:ABC transporter permease [bacterium]
MKTIDIVKRAGRNLGRAKSRTFLTAVAISVGGFAIVASLAAGTGAKHYVDQVISANMDEQSLVIYADSKFTDTSNAATNFAPGLREYDPDSFESQGVDMKALTQDNIDQLRQRDDLASVEPFYQLQPQYVTFGVDKGQKYSSDVYAYDGSKVSPTLVGNMPELHGMLGDDDAVIPQAYLKTLGIEESDAQKAIGSEVTVRVQQTPQSVDKDEIQAAFMKGGEKAVQKLTEGKTIDKTFQIVAVMGNSVNELDQQQGVFISSNAAKELSDFSTEGTDLHGKYMMAFAVVKDGLDPAEVKDSLKNDKFYASTAEDLQQLLFTFVNVLLGIVIGFGALALVVSVFGIINTQYISVLERTQQIGLMKALGASKRDIARLFRYEAAWVGFLGGALGAGAAWIAGTIANPWITDKLNLGDGNSLLMFELLPSIGVIVLLVIVAVVSGWLQSRKAARLDPIEALRTE